MTRFVAPEEPTGRWAVYNESYREINGNEFLGEFVPELEPYARRVTVVEKSTYGKRYNQDYVENASDAIVTDYSADTDFSFRYTGDGTATIYTYVEGDSLRCDIAISD